MADENNYFNCLSGSDESVCYTFLMSKENREYPDTSVKIWQMAYLMSLPTLVAIFVSPALPAIGRHFSVTGTEVQPLMSWFLAGFAFAQLLCLPTVNRFGIKPTLYVALGIYLSSVIFSWIALSMDSLQLLLYARIFMAVGSEPTVMIVITIINQYFSPSEVRRVSTYSMASVPILSALGLIIAGILTETLGWKSTFYFLFILGVFAISIALALPEVVKSYNPNALNPKIIAKEYSQAFRFLPIVFFGVATGLNISILYIIAGAGPFVGINYIGLSPAEYSLYLTSSYTAQIIGAYINGKLSYTISAKYAMTLGYFISIFGGIILLICFASGYINHLSLFIGLFIVMLGMPFVYSTTTYLAMSHYRDISSAPSVYSFIYLAMLFLVSSLLTWIPAIIPVIMPVLILFVLLLSLLCCFIAWMILFR